MRLVFQRVRQARVTVGGAARGAIGPGALILCGAARGDTPQDIDWLAGKVSRLRCFADAAGRMNLDIAAVQGSFLVVSQFTLLADCRQGNRPGYLDAAPPEEGRTSYEGFVAALRRLGHGVETGEFGADMQVDLTNDGPVTFVLESHGRAG